MIRQTFAAIAPLFLANVLQPASATQPHWPGWLGPDRNGWVRDFRPPVSWPKQLKKVWQREVGTGYGSPLVSGGFVFQHARQGEEEALWCLDLETGAVQWRKSHPVPFRMGGGGEWHGKGPKSSPALTGGRIFTMSITGVLSAYETASGKKLWRRNYGRRFPKPHPYWGAATSPLADGERAIVHFGGDEAGVLVALDAETGREIWSQGNDGASYSSPLAVEIEGIRQIIEWNHNVVAGVEYKTGRLLWQFPFPHVGNNQNMPTPAVHNGQVLVGGENRGIRNIKPKRNGDNWTATEQWHQRKVALDTSTAVVNGNRLYGFSHYGRGRIFCLDIDSGEILWQGPERTGEHISFLAIPGHILALLDSGELQILATTGDHYEKIASYIVAESPTWAPPVLLPNGLLVKDKTTLTLWSLDNSANRPAAPAR